MHPEVRNAPRTAAVHPEEPGPARPGERRCTRHTPGLPKGREHTYCSGAPATAGEPICSLEAGTSPGAGPYVTAVVLEVLVVVAAPPIKDRVSRVSFTTPFVVALTASAPVVLVAPAALGGEVVAGGAVVVAPGLEVALSVVVLAALAGTVVVVPAGEPAPAVVVVASLADVVGTGTTGVGPSPVHTEVEVVEDGVASRRVVEVLVRVCVTGTVVAGGLWVVGRAVVAGAVVAGAAVGGAVVGVVVVGVVVVGVVVVGLVVVGLVVVGADVVLDGVGIGDEVTAREVLGEEGSVVQLPCPDLAAAGEPAPRARVPPAPDVGGVDDVGGVVVERGGTDVVVETVPEAGGAPVVAVAAWSLEASWEISALCLAISFSKVEISVAS